MTWMSPDWLLQEFGSTLFWVSLAMVFVECGLLFPFLPGDTLLFALGVFVATGDLTVLSANPAVDLVAIIALCSVAALAGNVAGYAIGRAVGPRVYERDGRVLQRRRLDETHDFFERYGSRAVVIGRFVPFVRTFITLVAGVSRMERHRFVTWSAAGAVAWVASITLLGYFLGSAVPSLKDNIDYAILVILAFSAVPSVVHWVRRRREAAAR
jgi:membrane-associated protein